MNEEDDDEETDGIKVPFLMRKVSVIPCGIRGILVDKSWSLLINRAVTNARNVRYLGSRFINFHLTRLLHENKSLGKIDNPSLRRLFLCLATGTHPLADEESNKSIKKWHKITKCKLDDDMQSNVRGLNTIMTKTFETYHTAFKSYHTYGLFDHYKRLVAIRCKLSMKNAKECAAHIFVKLKIDLKPEIEELYKDTLTKGITNEHIDSEIVQMQEWVADTGSLDLERRIQMHYYIACQLEQCSDRKIAMAPLCSMKLPYIELCAKAVQDLYKFAISKKGASIMTEEQACQLKQPERILDILIQKRVRRKLDQGCYMITLMTDGITANLVWCRDVTCIRKITNVEKYKKDQAKYKAEKEAKIREQIKLKGKADKRTTRVQHPKIMEPSKYVKIHRTGLFDAKKGSAPGIEKGQFAICAAKRKSGYALNDDTPIVSIDPGHKNILTCANATIADPNPLPGLSLSLGEYYERIGNKAYRSQVNRGKCKNGVKDAETEISTHSLKTTNYKQCAKNIGVHLKHAKTLLGYYGSRNHARKRFEIRQSRDRFYSTIVNEIAPDPKTVIALGCMVAPVHAGGDAKFAATHSGLSSCPIAKVVDSLARNRRVVITPEYNTTKRCSYCRTPLAVTKPAKSNRTKTSVSGTQYRIPIHGPAWTAPSMQGLRHCTKCSQCVNRDKNAARGIFYAFLNNYKHGCMPAFLNKVFKRGEKSNSDKPLSMSADSKTILSLNEIAVPTP